MARARVHPHYKAPVEEPGAVPTIILDYLFMGEDDGKTIPMLAVKDRKSKAKWAEAVQKKGNDPHAVSVVVAAIRETGYRRIILKSDDEPAIIALKQQVKLECKDVRKPPQGIIRLTERSKA